MKLVDKGFILNAAEASRTPFVCCFTSLRRQESGRILASFQVASKKCGPDANCMVFETPDNGASWQLVSERFDSTFNGITGSVSGAMFGDL